MAKVKFGMMMTEASGKLGGQVFSKNRSGSYVRTKVTPSNPQTSAQTAVRSLLAGISTGWSQLTDAQRLGFNNAVNDWAKTDIFGDLKNPTGKNLYTSLNFNLGNSGQAFITSVPEKISIPSLVLLDAFISVSGTSITLQVEGDPAGFVVQVSATPPLSAGTSFYKGKYREIQYVPSADISTADFWDDYVAKFGLPALGDNISFRIKVIGENGQAGVPEVVKATITA